MSRLPLHHHKLLLVLLALLLGPGLAQARHGSAASDEIVLQLKWHHQFQFAGYYAALARGYYREEGLSVHIQEGSPSINPIALVQQGEAQFGIGASELLLAHSHGEPVLALAAIIQHSPLVLLARQDGQLTALRDLRGKRLQVVEHEYELFAMFQALGFSRQDFQLLPRTVDLGPLIRGEVDAIAAYSTDEPFELAKHQLPLLSISPRSAGIDFYGDTLFTSESFRQSHPKQVAAFVRASLRGWEYALQHPEEIVDLILLRYQPGKSRAHLLFEAEEMRRLILPELVDLGHMSQNRWQAIADRYAALGLLGEQLDLGRFLYNPRTEPQRPWLYWFIAALLVLVLLISGFAIYTLRLNLRLRQSEEGYRILHEASPMAILAWDRHRRITAWNPQAAAIFGWTAEEAIGRDIFDFMIPPDQVEQVEEILSHLQSSPVPLKSRNWNLTHEGKRILCEWQNSLLRDASGQLAGAIALARDITDQQRVEAALKASEQRFRLLAENAFDVIWIADLNGRFSFISPSVERLRGYTVAEAMQQNTLETLQPEAVEEVKTAMAHLQQSGELLKQHWEIDQPCKDGSSISTEVIVNVIRDERGRPQEIFGITRDITERKRLEARLLSMAHYDALTGLPNRVLFFDRLEQAVKQAQREAQRFELLFIDLDGFKAANDRHGHDFGDQVLCEVARRLLKHVRQSDTVARMGGDEFTVILNHLHSDDNGEMIVRQILESLAQPYRLQGREARLSASIGISLYPDHATESEQLLKLADSAMYQVKHGGKNAYAYSQGR